MKKITLLLMFIFCFNIFADSTKKSRARTLVELTTAINILDQKISDSKEKMEKEFLIKKRRYFYGILNKYYKDYHNVDGLNQYLSVVKTASEKEIIKKLIGKRFSPSENDQIFNINFKLDKNIEFYNNYIDEMKGYHNKFHRAPSHIHIFDPMEKRGLEIDNRELYLTFDDGPSIYTDKILDVLKKYDAKAVFFIVGKNIYNGKTYLETNKNRVKRAIKEGHIVGAHSYSHPNLIKIKDVKELKRQLKWNKELIEKVFDIKVDYFRAPYGSRKGKSFKIIKENYKSHILWDIDSMDWKKQKNTQLIYRTIKLAHLYNGGVVLFHDIQKRTSETLESIVSELKRSGFKFKRIDQKY